MLNESLGLWGAGSAPYEDPAIRAKAEALARIASADADAFVLLEDIARVQSAEPQSVIGQCRENGLALVGSGPSLAIRKWVAIANEIL